MNISSERAAIERLCTDEGTDLYSIRPDTTFRLDSKPVYILGVSCGYQGYTRAPVLIVGSSPPRTETINASPDLLGLCRHIVLLERNNNKDKALALNTGSFRVERLRCITRLNDIVFLDRTGRYEAFTPSG
ncbi:MAG: hypothetical protein A2939_03260 [Parcubacteria group bacterium RIFCSPLOWO2_01_FULL_48_18]|nr:MAG: hypothetical protein A3J67_01845 [Parcubacteria group bacterium RIFCSPHIGHO2_02_FULL_48_10b]OHB23408.1 MAG: hypothetical protein A2939_03260 [Parcubacteria group bacterium RIFCSPLOWO2_01_FULL_48_18]